METTSILLPTGGSTSATPSGESVSEAIAASLDRRAPGGDMVPGCGTHIGDTARGRPSEMGKKRKTVVAEPFALRLGEPSNDHDTC
jgi:hypothetical protein